MAYDGIYLKAAIEVLTTPGGPSRGMIDTAITALQAHQAETAKVVSRAVTIEDREAEDREIALAEGWLTQDDLEPPPYDEDGSIAYAEMLERQAEMAAERQDWAYREYR